MTTPLATLEIHGPVATLSLNRPDARNALSIPLLADLRARVDELSGRADVTVVVMTGAGKAFCAGMDLKAVLDNHELALQLLSSLADLTIAIRTLPQVTVAKVNGAAIGGGCGLATVADLCVTHADSKMGFPEVDLGVCPAVVAPWLVRKIGAGRARAVLLKGGLMSGTEAHDDGIADHVVSTLAELEPFTISLSQRLSAGGPQALRATKGLLNTIDGSLDREIVRRGAQLSASVLSTHDAQERLRAKLS
ncbi:MAG: enoyl-CoA hydratase/isomerase family protein [Phycisphaerales bacterium]|jgi:enoyl-CoA hydratase/carnithine racemase|nr:enoyl-CoA hydratase/isomerase family protein [Phycisphaerales bacterium]